MNKKDITRKFSYLKETRWNMFTIIFLLIVVLIAYAALKKIELQTKTSIREALQTVLQTTQEAIYIWVNNRKQNIKNIASSPTLKSMTKQLIINYMENDKELYRDNLQKVRAFLDGTIRENNDKGFFIISPQMINIASMRDKNIGFKNLIYEQRKSYISRVFEGEIVFVPTITSDVPLETVSGKLKERLPTIFIAAPIRDIDNSIMAALAFRIDPINHFTRIAQLGRLGETGETYAFDENGLLITESRFDHHLRRTDLVKPYGKGILSIRIADPGGNLLDGYIPKRPRNERPLTVMAQSATKGNSSFNTNGYRDYRGIEVFGAWLWDKELGFGMATEIDEKEAMSSYRHTSEIIILLITTTVILSTFLGFIMLNIRRESEEELLKAYDELEFKVQERTNSLQEAKYELEQANKQLELLATTDALTGLANRRILDTHLGEEWRRCARDNRPISLMMIDIDHFKYYNDTYGHQAGDECLKQVANLLKSSNVATRPGDIIARYGGEEFAVILSGVCLDVALKLAEHVLKVVANKKIEHKATKVPGVNTITLSIGLYCERKFKNTSSEVLLKKADRALYNSKSNGRNQVSVFRGKIL